jgi:hypothetical protein
MLILVIVLRFIINFSKMNKYIALHIMQTKKE